MPSAVRSRHSCSFARSLRTCHPLQPHHLRILESCAAAVPHVHRADGYRRLARKVHAESVHGKPPRVTKHGTARGRAVSWAARSGFGGRSLLPALSSSSWSKWTHCWLGVCAMRLRDVTIAALCASQVDGGLVIARRGQLASSHSLSDVCESRGYGSVVPRCRAEARRTVRRWSGGVMKYCRGNG